MFKKISIIGGGEIGGAVAYIVDGSGVNTSIWDKDPSRASSSSPEECLAGAEAVFFCVPSWVVRGVSQEFLSLLPPDIPLVFVSKGIEAETYLTAPEIAGEFVDKARIVFMGGPMIAEEIKSGKGGHAVFGGQPALTSSLMETFKKDKISAETSKDPFSIAVLGALKNIYAIALGAAEGSGMGINVKAHLFSIALGEMDSISRALGCDVSVFNSAGSGDLLATGLSRESSNYKSGLDFASGRPPEKLSEGMISVSALTLRLKGSPLMELPLISFVRKITANQSITPGDWHKVLND
jgi:glycerol-3-phosphate dehydrogenase (NAD(P)+)